MESQVGRLTRSDSRLKTLIVGAGEIGWALSVALKQYIPEFHDPVKAYTAVGRYEIMHVTFPYSDHFVEQVKHYQEQFQPAYTVIHSTVPPGTSLALKAISSPIIGIHPHLTESLLTFTKFIGGEQAAEVADYFRRCGMKVYLFDKAETCELMKILDTTFYGLCVEFTKDVKRLAGEHQVPFEAWTLWTDVYNQGYQLMGYPGYTRPNLVPIMKNIGGHCVLPNADLLDTPFTRFLKDVNK